MASNCVTSHPPSMDIETNNGTAFQLQMDKFEHILPGAQFADKHIFRNKHGAEISCTPLIVDFRRLLKSGGTISVIPGVSNRDLLHAVVGLYDVSLTDMQPDVIYDNVCQEWMRTIILVRDVQDTVTSLNAKRDKDKEKALGITDDESSVNQSDSSATEDESSSEAEKEDVLEPEEETLSKFADVFSDTDEESEDEEDDDDEEDFSKGINAFVKNSTARRKARLDCEGPVEAHHVGIENRLLACSTFKTYTPENDEDIIYLAPLFKKLHHITLVAVRKRFRKCGIGKYLLMQIKDPNVVGAYDAIIVHADNSAVNFFSRYGFSDDPVLNTKWSAFAEQFTHCTLMCFLPPFTGQSLLGKDTPELDLIEMEKEIKKWKKKSLEAYQSQIGCLYRVRHEIIHLRALVSSQQELISSLATENKNLATEKFKVEKEFLQYRLAMARDILDDNNKESSEGLEDEEEDLSSSEDIIKELEMQMNSIKLARAETARKMLNAVSPEERSFMVSNKGTDEPYDHGKDMEEFFNITCDFKDSMTKDTSTNARYEVSMINKAHLLSSVEEAFKSCTKQMADSSMVTRLYYCGGLERPDRISDILRRGFSEEDFSYGEYGRGLYFSKYPSRAAQFSAFGRMILCEVGIGKTETVMKKEVTRQSPSTGFDSIITPGRLSSATGDGDSTFQQEYVVFSIHQACPIYVVDYAPM